ncbi:MAG: hypothetical protein WD512_15765 [Candidatus Paceibacterota bacterium]
MGLQVISAILFVRYKFNLTKYTKEKHLSKILSDNFDDYIKQMNREQTHITAGISVLLVSFMFSGLGIIFQQLETFSLVNDVWTEFSELKEQLLTNKTLIP